MGCSRRTLYELAPSKEQLQLVVLDRLLQRIGRQALAAVALDGPVIDQLRQYVTSGIDWRSGGRPTTTWPTWRPPAACSTAITGSRPG